VRLAEPRPGHQGCPAFNSSAVPLPERTGSAAGMHDAGERLDRRPDGRRDPGDTSSSTGASTAVAAATDAVPPEDAVVRDHRATVPAELSADVWRT
jgi:hypothetical protein